MDPGSVGTPPISGFQHPFQHRHKVEPVDMVLNMISDQRARHILDVVIFVIGDDIGTGVARPVRQLGNLGLGQKPEWHRRPRMRVRRWRGRGGGCRRRSWGCGGSGLRLGYGRDPRRGEAR